MKKALIIVCLVLGSMMNLGAVNQAKSKDVESLALEYRNREGFEVVSLGRLGLGLIKGAAVLSGELDEEDRAALKVFNGIKRLVIVDFESADAKAKKEFTRKAEKLLSKMELVIEAKDGGETMSIYGIEDGGFIRDCVLYSSDGALLITKGRISLDHVGELMEMSE